MAYNHNYSFTRTHHKNGKETKWHQVVKFIKKHGAVSKKDIVYAIWGSNFCSKESVRGYQSSMFAQMNEIHPEGVYYDKKLRIWTTYNFINRDNTNSIKQLERVIESMK